MNEMRSGATLVRPAKAPDVSLARRVQMRIKNTSDYPDHLVCRKWDGTTEGTVDINVAKPWFLRRTPFDGQTRAGVTYTYTSHVQRTADDGSGTETQVINPSFVLNDVIYVVRDIEGGTDVTEGGEPVVWLAEYAGRAWAKQTGT